MNSYLVNKDKIFPSKLTVHTFHAVSRSQFKMAKRKKTRSVHLLRKKINSHIGGCHERCYSESALKTSNDYVAFVTSTFLHFVLRREMGSAVSRSSEGKSYYRNMKPFRICVFLILTWLGFMSASGNTKTEGKSCLSLEKESFTFSVRNAL